MSRILFATLVSAPLMAGLAIAQTTPAPAPNAPAVKVEPSKTQPAASVAAKPGPWLGTQIWKQAVYDSTETRIGEIDNLLFNEKGQVTEAIIGVGGFLGIGEKAVAVPFADLKPMVRDGNIWFMLNTTKDKMKEAPTFDASKYKR